MTSRQQKKSRTMVKRGAARSNQKRAGGTVGSVRSNRSSAPAVSGLSRSDVSTVVRMPAAPLFPSRSKSMMLPYYMNASLTVPVTGLATGYVFSANGLYDPDVSGVGTQPMGFDQMMIFYEHYTVTEAKIVVTFRNFSTAIAPVVFIAFRADTVLSTDPKVVMETGNAISTQLMPANIDGSLKELTLRGNIGRFLGFDDLQDSNVARGDISSNPAEGAFFHVGAFYNEGAATGSVSFQVRLEYRAVFTEPRIITASLSRGMHSLIIATTDCKTK